MSVFDHELLHHLSRMPFVDTAELAMITGEAHATVHRGLAGLRSEGIVGRVSQGAARTVEWRQQHRRRAEHPFVGGLEAASGADEAPDAGEGRIHDQPGE